MLFLQIFCIINLYNIKEIFMEILNSKQIDLQIENLAKEILNQHIDNIAIVDSYIRTNT